MKVGLLWYDDDKHSTLTEKVVRATDHYRQKYGTAANTCYVHPSTLSGNGKTVQVGRVRVVTLRTVLLHHFWVGVEGQP